jgi:hypothetical protein
VTTWSLCTLNWELPLLEQRLQILDEVVDIHVVAEAPVTHRGEPKPLYLSENWERFKPWHSKIRRVVVRDMPTGQEEKELGGQGPVLSHPGSSDHWDREEHQRAALSRGLYGLRRSDLVLLSDLDEIPNPACFEEGERRAREGQIAAPMLAMHVYAMHWRWREALPGVARFFTGETFEGYGGDLAAIRDPDAKVETRFGPSEAPALGWHCAYMGGVEAIQRKLRDIAHHELDVERFNNRAHIERSIETGADIFGRPDRQAERCPEGELPPCL